MGGEEEEAERGERGQVWGKRLRGEREDVVREEREDVVREERGKLGK